MTPDLCGFDHLVLTVRDLGRTITFYTDILGMTTTQFRATDGSERWALSFARHKINLHQAGAEFAPRARQATPGSADLCFLSHVPLAVWQTHLCAHNVAIDAGPVKRNGATGPILSIYLRDPDGNLIEIANRCTD